MKFFFSEETTNTRLLRNTDKIGFQVIFKRKHNGDHVDINQLFDGLKTSRNDSKEFFSKDDEEEQFSKKCENPPKQAQTSINRPPGGLRVACSDLK